MLKKLFIALSITGALASASAFAAEAPASLPQVNLATAFEKSEQPMQIAALSTVEMEKTQGAFFFLPIGVVQPWGLIPDIAICPPAPNINVIWRR